ncbi:predicted protein [Postia placenta Mad-698-R]|uniref:Uncharacterized protein n=1 Tax=Postia placenta MAD-698-R-SB12 TaxID=670580 RepID=A0A1X6MLR6_9APHY|nr:hypothetical protein POSPLADRAFT_1050292 [Postia placenta MAD-698-R-SB12]EED78624.1 predicted protein [Postia placenta Mad-698-R]OSX57278.1 hypothetical protein POSPLADRAFT_1050292 [Postia placenta MAD-698-R-SB12]
MFRADACFQAYTIVGRVVFPSGPHDACCHCVLAGQLRRQQLRLGGSGPNIDIDSVNGAAPEEQITGTVRVVKTNAPAQAPKADVSPLAMQAEVSHSVRAALKAESGHISTSAYCVPDAMFGEHTCDTVPESEASTCSTGSAAKIAQRVQSLAAAARDHRSAQQYKDKDGLTGGTRWSPRGGPFRGSAMAPASSPQSDQLTGGGNEAGYRLLSAARHVVFRLQRRISGTRTGVAFFLEDGAAAPFVGGACSVLAGAAVVSATAVASLQGRERPAEHVELQANAAGTSLAWHARHASLTERREGPVQSPVAAAWQERRTHAVFFFSESVRLERWAMSLSGKAGCALREGACSLWEHVVGKVPLSAATIGPQA